MNFADVVTTLSLPPGPSWVLALAATAHLGLTAIRHHRTGSRLRFLTVVSFLLTVLPWLLPSTIGLAAGLGAHILWFVTCEKIAPPRAVVSRVVPVVAAPAAASASRTASLPTTALKETPVRQAPKGFIQTPILAVFDETPLIRTVRLARPEGFEFIAGQFVTVRVRVDGKEYARCYSVSSAPHVRGYLEISIKRQGLVSNALHATARPGGQLFVKAPVGAFRYPAGDDRPIVLLAGGIGITPLISMMRHAVATEPSRPVALVYSAHTQDDFAFRDELMTMVRRHPQVRVQLAVAAGASHPSIYPGHIDESLLRATVPDLAHSISFICGPAAMIDAMKALLTRMGVPASQIRHEVFQQAVAASAGREHEEVLVGAEAGRAVAETSRQVEKARHGGGSPAGHQMQCAKSRKAVPVHRGQTLLEAAEEHGVAVDSLCRAGVCGTCRVQVTAGRVDCDSSTLDADDRAHGFVLACVSTANSDCTVNL